MANEKGYDSPESGSAVVDAKAANGELDDSKITFLRMRIFAMALIVSMGGFIFGYDTGQISGFLETPDFLQRFGEWNGKEYAFTNVRSGLIVGLVCLAPTITFVLHTN